MFSLRQFILTVNVSDTIFFGYTIHYMSSLLATTASIVLFECDKHSDHRQFIFDQFTKLQHPLFQLIDDWYNLIYLIQFFVLAWHLLLPQTIALFHNIILPLFALKLRAMIIPNLRQLLQPLHSFNIRLTVLIDLEDSTEPKYISLHKGSNATVQLCS